MKRLVIDLAGDFPEEMKITHGTGGGFPAVEMNIKCAAGMRWRWEEVVGGGASTVSTNRTFAGGGGGGGVVGGMPYSTPPGGGGFPIDRASIRPIDEETG